MKDTFMRKMTAVPSIRRVPPISGAFTPGMSLKLGPPPQRCLQFPLLAVASIFRNSYDWP